MSSDIRIEREYPHPRSKVWRALTDPKFMALWGMRPEGFVPVVGTKFRLIGQPNRLWRGFIESEVTVARAPEVIGYTWIGNEGQKPTHLQYTLDEIPRGTRLIVEHTGFTGIGGFLFTTIFMKPGLTKMVDRSLPPVLADIADDGSLRPGSALKPMF